MSVRSRVCLVLLWIAFMTPAYGQLNTGRILGSVTDQSGGILAGAKIVVTNVQTGVARNLVTDQSGQYVAPDLSPGTYSVHAEAPGFQAVNFQNVQVDVGKDIRVDLQMTVGEVSQTIEVTNQAPIIDTTSATLGGVLTNEIINDLPLNGRNFENLIQLRPGVLIVPGGGAWTQDTNGLRPDEGSYLLDGVNNDNNFVGQSVINQPGFAGDAATLLPIDAIQEFNVEVNPKAQFGWKGGSIVNVVLKSGTNSIHGTAYAFGRTQSLDARNFFNPVGQPKQPVDLEQFGASIGGPLIKQKLFYFGSYEGLRYDVGNSYTESIPTTAPGLGPSNSIPDAEAGLAANSPAIPVNPLSVKLLSTMFASNSSATTNLTFGFPNIIGSDNGVAKIDYHLNDNNTLTGSYMFGNGNLNIEDSPYMLQKYDTLQHTRIQVADIHWVSTINSRWVNEAMFGYTRYAENSKVGDNTTPPTAYGINTGVTNPLLFGAPAISISGFTTAGPNSGQPGFQGPNTTYDVIDQLSYTLGKHAFMFGGEVRDDLINNTFYGTGRGQFFFSGGAAFPRSTPLEDYLGGFPSFAHLITGNNARSYSQKAFALFAQDDWRIKPRVNVNLGLRYEYSGALHEANNLLGNWEPSIGLEQAGNQISSPYNPEVKNFEPRLGVAWDISGNGTTVVRAGGSLIYYTLLPLATYIGQNGLTNAPGAQGVSLIPTGATVVVNGVATKGTGTIQSSTLTIPSSSINWTLAGPVLPPAGANVQCGDGIGADPTPCSITAMNRNLKSPFVTNWTLSVEHAFSPVLSLDVAYVGNHGGNQVGDLDLNQINPQSPAEIACGHCEANVDRPYGRQYPYLQFINYLTNLYSSNYNGMQATLTARNMHGLSFVLGYTYSHALDFTSSNVGPMLPQSSLDPAAEYASSDFDLRHRFTFSWTYNIPGRKSWGQLLQGWQVNSIISLQSGMPWAVFDTSQDISKTGENVDRWDFFGNPADFRVTGPTPIPFYSPSQPAPFNVFPAMCTQEAAAIGTAGPGGSLQQFGCYAQGNSVLIAPPIGTYGTMGRNMFYGPNFQDVDFSLFKNWKFKERLTAQFRVEVFNIFNHPNFANPWLGATRFGQGSLDDPSAPGLFGCACATPDVAAANPVLGSGSNRAMQLGLKLIF